MKKFEVEVQDRRDIKKMQRIVLILERLAGMFDKYGEIEIIVKIKEPAKKWWKLWR